MLTRQRIEEALDEVVKRGRMTRDDASQLGQALFIVGRQQTDDVLKDLEQLLGRGRSNVEQRTGTMRGRSVTGSKSQSLIIHSNGIRLCANSPATARPKSFCR